MIVDMFGDDRGKGGYPQLFTILLYGTNHSLTFDCLHKDMQVVIQPGVLSAQVYDGAACVHYRGVVTTAKGFADLGKAM
jgi:hypothetical protein